MTTPEELAKDLRPKGFTIRGHWGVVQEVDPGTPNTIQFTLDGGTTILAGYRYFNGYPNPAAGDTVMILELSPGDYVVLGDLA